MFVEFRLESPCTFQHLFGFLSLHLSIVPHLEEALCLRTDFDSFELPSQKATEYVVRGKIPSALQEARESVKGFKGSRLAVTLKDFQEYHGNLPGVRRELRKARQRSPDAKAWKYLLRKKISLSYHFHWCLKSSFSHLVTWKLQGVARSFHAAAKIREETVQAPKQVKVFTQVGVLGTVSHVTVACYWNHVWKWSKTQRCPGKKYKMMYAPLKGVRSQVGVENAMIKS